MLDYGEHIKNIHFCLRNNNNYSEEIQLNLTEIVSNDPIEYKYIFQISRNPALRST